MKFSRIRENQTNVIRKRPKGTYVRAAIAPCILLRRPIKFEFEEHDIIDQESGDANIFLSCIDKNLKQIVSLFLGFNGKKYSAQSSSDSIESKSTAMLQQLMNVQSDDKWPKHTEGDISSVDDFS